MERLVRTGGLAGRHLVCFTLQILNHKTVHTQICKRLFYTKGDNCLDHRKSGMVLSDLEYDLVSNLALPSEEQYLSLCLQPSTAEWYLHVYWH